MVGEGWNLLLKEKGDTSEDYGRGEGMNPDGLPKTKLQKPKNSIVRHSSGCNKQPQRLSYTVKMRLGANENADRGILLAATTEHFGSIGKSLGRLFTTSAALTTWNF